MLKQKQRLFHSHITQCQEECKEMNFLQKSEPTQKRLRLQTESDSKLIQDTLRHFRTVSQLQNLRRIQNLTKCGSQEKVYLEPP